MKKVKTSKQLVKRNIFYTPVYLTTDGRIYVDYSSRNIENKIIFRRINANEIVNNSKTRDWNIKKEIKEILFYLQKDGLEILNTQIEMVPTVIEYPDNHIERENYFFAVVKEVSKFRNNDDVIPIELEDFLADENIYLTGKFAVTSFYNGKTEKF